MVAFSITSPTAAVVLDQARRGLVQFTVANQTGRALSARMSVTPFPPASGDWFWIEVAPNGSDRPRSVERFLPSGGSETCTVRIEVPADAPAGAQAFRLDVVSVDHPDEEWIHGPAVGFEIPAPLPEPPPPPPGYIETVGGAVAGAIAAIGLGSLVGLLIALALGLSLASSVTYGFVTLFGGAVVAAVALGGAIGAFGALVLRAIPRPDPWQTALAYLVAALVLGTILQLATALVPRPAGATVVDGYVVVARTGEPLVYRTVEPYVIVTAVPVIVQPTAIVIVTSVPTRTTAPTGAPPTTVPPAPRPTPVVVVATPDVSPALTVLLALLAAILAALAARAFTRWRILGTL